MRLWAEQMKLEISVLVGFLPSLLLVKYVTNHNIFWSVKCSCWNVVKTNLQMFCVCVWKQRCFVLFEYQTWGWSEWLMLQINTFLNCGWVFIINWISWAARYWGLMYKATGHMLLINWLVHWLTNWFIISDYKNIS